MNSNVMFENPLEHARWDEWMGTWSTSSIFHTAGWSRVLAETYGYRPCHAVLWASGTPRAVLPLMEMPRLWGGRRAASMPHSDYCPALCREASEAPLLLAGVFAEAAAQDWRSVAIRGLPGQATPARPCYLHTLSLGGTEEEQWQRCRPAVRRAIRKAEHAGLRLQRGCSEDDVRTFFRLHVLTRRRHGLPPPPWQFFQSLQRHLLARGAGTVITAWKADQAVAAAVFLHFGRQALFKYGASDARAQSDRPNDLILWDGIRWSRALGCTVLSLGTTRLVQEGLRHFKLGWGTAEQQLDELFYDVRKATFVRTRDAAEGWYNGVFRHMPLPLLCWAGEVLYRRAA